MKRISALCALLLCAVTLHPVLAKDDGLENAIKEAFEAGDLPGLHGVYVLRKGEIFAEAYFEGDDENWGEPLKARQHGPDELHDLRSVSKSITSLLYGIALADGKVPALDAPVVDSFPQYADLVKDPARRKILIRHVLMMKMGTEWNEDLPYTDPKNSEIAMEFADDRYRFILDRPMVTEPGDWWTYNGGATALIAKLIADGTGQKVDAYARDALFAPLGITEFEWARGADGEPAAASGLRMKARDLAKIGQMIHDDGMFGGKQVVSAAWLAESMAPSTTLRTGLRYGYFWWMAAQGDPPYWIAGSGNGGQRLAMNAGPSKLVTVIFGGRYNDPNGFEMTDKVTDLIFEALAALKK